MTQGADDATRWFLDRLEERADERGQAPRLARAFAAAVIKRLPPELARTDVAPSIESLLDTFGRVATDPGPWILLTDQPPTLDPSGRPVTVLQLHGEDRPFVLSTVRATLQHLGIGSLRQLHPIVGVERDQTGNLTDVLPARSAERRESLIHVETTRVLDDDQRNALRDELGAALTDLRAATDDWQPMRDRLHQLAARIRDGELSPGTPLELREEVAALLEWLDEDNLVLLGVRSYDVVDQSIAVRSGSGLGILSDESASRYALARPLDELDEHQRDRLFAPRLLRVGRSHQRSLVQRRAPLDSLVVIERTDDGEAVAVHRIVGLFTRGALAQPARTTPVLRRRLGKLLEAEDVVSGSYDENQLIEVFEAIPRDELFSTELDDLRRLVVDLVRARERDDVQVVVRHDPGAHTVSIVATVPGYRYEPRVRRAFTEHLAGLLEVDGVRPEIDADLSLADDNEVLARFTAHLPSDAEIELPTGVALGAELRRLTRAWGDAVEHELRDIVGEGRARRLATDVVPRIPTSYRDATTPEEAVEDVIAIDEQDHDLDVRIDHQDDGAGRVRALVRGSSLVLSRFLPLLEDLGLAVLDEHPYEMAEGDGPELHLHDFGVTGLPGALDVPSQVRVGDTLRAAWDGRTTSDSLHRLVLSAGLSWREVAVLRAYRRYRRQVGTAFTPAYANEALATNPTVVAAVVALFRTMFDPDVGADADADQLAGQVEDATREALQACDAVERLDHDRILRDLVALVRATLRTNHYVPGAQVTVLKIDPSAVPDVPRPVPHREIFVFGPHVEGIHLRAGRIARGGLRWSDRQDDVRTEVLGLMKAQVLKNSVIVPTGAKGGFVLQQPPADRDQLRAEVRRQYAVFVDGLLSVTDDLEGETVVPPDHVRRWDGDDPYLVVAADKGTATFSDVANEIAEGHGFWLGDAFASGGSKGYDHKALAITARGAWVAVRRHLLELGIHPEQEPVSVVGVGDMSGDVFGNGMLQSRTIRLLAAFDHRDIFLDPEPDPAASFAERQRLFDLPRSTWQDYDREALSPGGMIVPRSRKRVELTPEVRDLLGLEKEVVEPQHLMSAVLRASVDLLWFGGIGTYIKDPDERHEDVGDRSNDEIRVDADEVRARVVGEGANLSVTQRARIRFARRGGRIDQDAIHNVGGVDCSDHEVNVKILLAGARGAGLLTGDERDQLLVDVTDDVVDDVLRDVDLQVWRISRDLREDASRLVDVAHLLDELESNNDLDRAVQVLPASDELRDRREQGATLTRPEWATLLGSAKRRLTDELLATDLVDSETFGTVLDAYIPGLLEDRFPDQLRRHRLRPELVATRAANELVDRMGPTFPSRVAAETDLDEATVASAWFVAREVTGVDAQWRELEGLLDLIGPERQDEVARELEVLLGSLTRRYATEPEVDRPDRLVARDGETVRAFVSSVFDLGVSEQRRHRLVRAERLRDDLVPDGLAQWVACVRDAAFAPDVATTVRALEWEPDSAPLVGDVLLHVLDQLGLDRLHRVLDRMSTTTVWRRRLRRSLAADLRSLAGRAAQLALTEQTGDLLADGGTTALRFVQRRAAGLERARRTITAVEQDVQAGLDGVTVALRSLRTAVEDGS